jgi:hypothetical protein
VLLVSKINTPRHDFGTVVANRTGNLKAVMKVMGHSIVRAVLNQGGSAPQAGA